MSLQEYVENSREALDEIDQLLQLKQKINDKYEQPRKMEPTPKRQAYIEVLEWLLGKTPASWGAGSQRDN